MTDNLPAKRRPGRPQGSLKFNLTEVEHALTMRAFARNDYEAVEMLKGDENLRQVPAVRTIQLWRTQQHSDLYAQILDRTAPQREKLVIDKIIPRVEKAFDTADKAMDVLSKQLDDPDFRDPAGAARNAATTGAILVDKMLALQGRPTSTIEHRNPVEILRLLSQRGRVVDGTAEEAE